MEYRTIRDILTNAEKVLEMKTQSVIKQEKMKLRQRHTHS